VDPHSLTPLIIAALVIWAVYRRVRRTFGPQSVRPRALAIRAGIFTLLAIVIFVWMPKTPALLGAIAGGMIAGVVLGYFGLRHTRFETTQKGRVYIPHTYIGLFVTSLLIIRLAMRFLSMNGAYQQYGSEQNPWAAYQRNPLTVAILGLVVGYYVFYNIGILRRSREPEPPVSETSAP
jgi:drug/metabolite transporter superfamily protein YnfA